MAFGYRRSMMDEAYEREVLEAKPTEATIRKELAELGVRPGLS